MNFLISVLITLGWLFIAALLFYLYRSKSLIFIIIGTIALFVIITNLNAYGPRLALPQTVIPSAAQTTPKIEPTDLIKKQNQWRKLDEQLRQYQQRQQQEKDKLIKEPVNP